MLVGGLVFIACCPLGGGQAVQAAIVNPDAEAGNTSGWNDQGGLYVASNGPTPREGSWFFETSEHLDLFGSREMTQLIDVSDLTGMIQDVELSVSMAASRGFAETTGPAAETWNYQAQAGLRFFDINMDRLPVSLFGPLVVGDDSLQWTDRVTSWAAFPSQSWEDSRSSIAFIELSLSGAWSSSTRLVFDPPAGSIIDIPEVTRFDAIGLNVVVPEPATLTLIGVGALVLLKRRRGRQLSRE